MSYVDGFVAAVPTANRETYRLHAEEAARIFREHGALSFVGGKACGPGTPRSLLIRWSTSTR